MTRQQRSSSVVARRIPPHPNAVSGYRLLKQLPKSLSSTRGKLFLPPKFGRHRSREETIVTFIMHHMLASKTKTKDVVEAMIAQGDITRDEYTGALMRIAEQLCTPHGEHVCVYLCGSLVVCYNTMNVGWGGLVLMN